MSNGLCSLSDIYVEISTTVTQQGSDGQQTEKVQTKLETLAAVIQKRVLSLNPAMMTFSQIDFTPYVGRFGKTKHGVFNTFPGFPHRPADNGVELDYTPIMPFLNGMKEIICNNDDSFFQCVCDTYSDLLQNPERKSRVCSVYYSPEQQVGKGLFSLLLGTALVGEKMIVQVANDSLIIGDFNALLENKLLIVVDESESHGASYKFSGRLKNLITEPTTLINRKGFDAFKVCSCLRVMYCTNTIDALQIDLFDKRFFMLQCNPSRIGQTEFFDQMETIAKEHGWLLWNFFYHRKLSRKDWKNHLPSTPLKQQMMQRKFPTPIQFVISCPDFWQGDTNNSQKQHLNASQLKEIKWHYDTLFQTYRSWALSEGIDAKFLGKDWTYLVEPLKNIGIHPHSGNKERIRINNRRFKGFSIQTQELVEAIKQFLSKAGQNDASEFEIPIAQLQLLPDEVET